MVAFSFQSPQTATRNGAAPAITEAGAVATALNLRKRLRYGPNLVAYNKGFASDISLAPCFGSWEKLGTRS
jgi:hypothetical protein